MLNGKSERRGGILRKTEVGKSPSLIHMYLREICDIIKKIILEKTYQNILIINIKTKIKFK